MHVDTVNTHVVSAIINVDQQLDEEVSRVLVLVSLGHPFMISIYLLFKIFIVTVWKWSPVHSSFCILLHLPHPVVLFMFRAHSLSSLILTSSYLLFNDPSLSLPCLPFLFLALPCLTNRIQWPLLILDHDDNEHEIQMSPGDMVLYESAKLLHGRPSTYTVQISPLSIFCLLASHLSSFHSIIHSSNPFTRCVLPSSYSSYSSVHLNSPSFSALKCLIWV